MRSIASPQNIDFFLILLRKPIQHETPHRNEPARFRAGDGSNRIS